MVSFGIESFQNKNVLLLQGPIGPFFKRFAFDLKQAGAKIRKINFNGGDWFFSSRNSINFRDSIHEWPAYVSGFIETHQIDVIILFGDCREYHRIAHAVAQDKGIEIGVFEEGYVRPDFITLEHTGVNGFSNLPKNPDFYYSLDDADVLLPHTEKVGNSFWHTAWYAMLYYLSSVLLSPLYPHYQHHRPLELFEITYWIKSIYRKQYYRLKQFGLQDYLSQKMSKQYFLVPLQIATDSQIHEHSRYDSLYEFIKKTICSFSKHAHDDTLLVIKHHPLDRGYHDYHSFIERKALQYGVKDRVHYIHDQHLPILLDNACGVVLINSTVGLSALHHNAPIKAMCRPIYDIPGLTYHGTLDNFWKDAHLFKIDRNLYERFRGYVINHKQINGNFYRRIANTSNKAGIRWN